MRVEQLLHGYSDGHRLLAASKDLPRAAKHLMLILSDMAGRSIVPGFEEYLTGYAVPESEYYAFAKTWYASEMERPGCVWTQTLLIDATDVAQLPDLSTMQSLFRRPNKGATFQHYGHPLEVLASAPIGAMPPPLNDLTVAVVSALYATPEAPVLVPVENSVSLLDLVFAVWNQQWPQLREAFSFCTGSMSSRSIAGRPLDLQLIPYAAVREIRREVPGAVLIDTDGPASRPHFPDWIVAATADLAQPDQRLRNFLSQFGSLLDGRAGFEPLMQLRVCLAEATTRGGALEDLVDVIAERFPTDSEARRLKAAVLGAQRPITRSLYPDRQDSDLLTLLATTEHEQAFDVNDLEIDDRVRHLWTEDRVLAGRFVDQLLSGNHNLVGERALTAILTAVPVEQVPEVFADKPAFLVSAIRRDPNLATLASLWSGSADRQRELFDAATAGHQIDDSLRERIVMAMLEAGSDAVADHVLLRFGDVVVRVILDWFNDLAAGGAASLPLGWRRCLTQHSATVLQWLSASQNRRPQSVALAAEMLDAHARDVHAAGLDVWIEAISKSGSLPDDARIRLHAFGLALAFDIASQAASSLAVLTFDTVHTAAATSRLGYDAWSLFEYHVPFLSRWRNWDKCERLRRGLIERFEKNQWAVDQFIRCAKSVKTFIELLKTSSAFPEGKSLLQRMQNEQFQLVKELPPDWRAAFSYYV